MKRLPLLATGFILSCILLLSGAPFQSITAKVPAIVVHSSETFDENGTLFNDCTGEMIDFSGQGHLVMVTVMLPVPSGASPFRFALLFIL